MEQGSPSCCSLSLVDFLKIQPPKFPIVQLKMLVCLLSPFPRCNKHFGMHILQFTGWFFWS